MNLPIIASTIGWQRGTVSSSFFPFLSPLAHDFLRMSLEKKTSTAMFTYSSHLVHDEQIDRWLVYQYTPLPSKNSFICKIKKTRDIIITL